MWLSTDKAFSCKMLVSTLMPYYPHLVCQDIGTMNKRSRIYSTHQVLVCAFWLLLSACIVTGHVESRHIYEKLNCRNHGRVENHILRINSLPVAYTGSFTGDVIPMPGRGKCELHAEIYILLHFTLYSHFFDPHKITNKACWI